jgi:hypothetical protein
MLENGTRIF